MSHDTTIHKLYIRGYTVRDCTREQIRISRRRNMEAILVTNDKCHVHDDGGEHTTNDSFQPSIHPPIIQGRQLSLLVLEPQNLRIFVDRQIPVAISLTSA